MVLPDHVDHVGSHAVGRAQPKLPIALVEHVHNSGIGAGELGRLGDDGVQHGLQVERGVDRLADLAERAQLLDRLRKFARARLHLVEQPHVLDRDHCLVGEGCDQLDLLVGERPHLVRAQDQHADRAPLAQQRHAEHGAKAAQASAPR